MLCSTESSKSLNRPELAPDLRRFILTSVPSVPYLEAVLLLRAQPTTSWTPGSMARRLYLPEAEVAGLLEAAASAELAERRDATEGPQYMFKPASPELAQVIDQLATHYAVDIVTVTDLIHSRVDKRAQQFASAFRWRKDS